MSTSKIVTVLGRARRRTRELVAAPESLPQRQRARRRHRARELVAAPESSSPHQRARRRARELVAQRASPPHQRACRSARKLVATHQRVCRRARELAAASEGSSHHQRAAPHLRAHRRSRIVAAEGLSAAQEGLIAAIGVFIAAAEQKNHRRIRRFVAVGRTRPRCT